MCRLRAGATIAALLWAMPGCSTPHERPELVIAEVLQTQAEAWNRGDIDAFMEHYWKSEQLTFSAGGQTTRGWTDTLANYKKRYPTRQAMGYLEFDDLWIRPLADDAALVLGRWHLVREPEPIGGNFSLVFQRLSGRWLIVHDHTSRSAPSESSADHGS